MPKSLKTIHYGSKIPNSGRQYEMLALKQKYRKELGLKEYTIQLINQKAPEGAHVLASTC